jgi:maltooligosyltrehalose trehalohydrolase
VIAGAASNRRVVDGAVLSPHAFAIRYESPSGDDRLLIVNLGIDLDLTPLPEPLLAPRLGYGWVTLWHSEAIEYGGSGLAPLHPHAGWHLMGESAILLRPGKEKTDADGD